MNMLDYITAGESHGEYLSAILRGMPSGLKISLGELNEELTRRQAGFGRGGRMRIESDSVTVPGGLINGKTTGAPLGFLLVNTDHKINDMPALYRPRPGHADLTGALKYDEGIREILERASARETAMRVAVGAVCKQFLNEFGITIISHVVRIGSVSCAKMNRSFVDIAKRAKKSCMNCASEKCEKAMIGEIKKTSKRGDTIGGEFEVLVSGVPVGLGSHAHYAQKLDARLARGLMSIQAIKAVEIGLGVACGSLPGSHVHDEIFYAAARGYFRKTNYAGGIEGGISNGSDIVVRATMKPIATLKKSLRSVDMRTKKEERASFERSDVCAVPACSVIGEAVVAYEIADALLEKCGGDSLKEVKRNYQGYLKQVVGYRAR
jgi:chorismate synthase